MSNVTVIFTEKPAAARAAAEALGKLPGQPNSGAIMTRRGIVTHGIGHLIRQKMPEEVDEAAADWSNIAVTIDPIPVTPIEQTARQLQTVTKLLQKADLVLLAGDVGREGELIGYECFDYARYRGTIQRVLLKSLEPSAVKDAFANPRPAHETYPWYLEARARQENDYWIGLTSTRGASTRLRPREAGRAKWAMGPVKGPALALICDREIAIRRHVPEDYRVLWLDTVTEDGRALRLRHPEPGKPVLKDLALAERILAAARTAAGPLEVTSKLERVGPPQPFNIDAFLRKMGKTYNVPSDRAFKALERLYNAGYMTYPRTPARTWATAQAASAPAILEKLARLPGLEAAGAAASNPVIRRGSRYAEAKEHDALAPTRKVPALSELGADEKAAYLCVVRNYIANHLPDAEDHKTRVRFGVSVPGHGEPVPFAATGTVEKSPGWRVAFGAGRGAREEGAEETPIGKAAAEDEGSGRLPDLRNGEVVRARDVKAETKQTEPPPRFAEAEIPTVLSRLIDLVDDPKLKQALENPDDPKEPKGLGTPATRKDVGPELLELGYIEKDGKAVKPTSRGMAVYFAHQQDPLLKRQMEPVNRAELEFQLAKIGQAPSVDEAERRHRTFRTRALAETREVAAAYERAVPFSPDLVPEDLRPLVAGLGASAVSTKQLQLVRKIAKDKKIKLTPGMVSDPAAVRAFLDEHVPKRDKGANGPPTDKQITTIEKIAGRRKDEEGWDPDKRAPGWRESAKAASGYLDWAIKTIKAEEKQAGGARTSGGRSGSSGSDRSRSGSYRGGTGGRSAGGRSGPGSRRAGSPGGRSRGGVDM